jgi:cobalt-zinc-cadmium efflux system outer membrane protein
MSKSALVGLVVALSLTAPAPAQPPTAGSKPAIEPGPAASTPAKDSAMDPAIDPAMEPAMEPTPESEATSGLRDSLEPRLRALVAEVLLRNPDLARARREAMAAELRAPQVRSLPDPMASVTGFLSSPETRVGPQEMSVMLSQRLRWFGKLALREQAALFGAAAARAEVEARAVTRITETRRLYYELAFLEAEESAVRHDRDTLEHYEELARTRYASGVGLEQAVVKIQAEITKDDNRLLGIATRRAALTAALNALRDRPPETPLPPPTLPDDRDLPKLDYGPLETVALAARPEVARERARMAQAATGVDLARKDYLPDFNVGLAYTRVGPRDDAAGRAMPPEGNGDDILGVTAGINVPLWRKKLAAGVEEASQRELAAQEGLRGVAAGIHRDLGDLLHRIPQTREQLDLFRDVLTVQADEALRSAEAAYSAGALGALDLLDAERVLLEVRIAAARTAADLAVAVARLEGVLASPIGDNP